MTRLGRRQEASSVGGIRQRRPLRPEVRRGGDVSRAMRKGLSLSRALGRVRGGWPARGTSGRSSLVRGRQWRLVGSVLARGEVVAL
jgi:hypothetical protein